MNYNRGGGALNQNLTPQQLAAQRQRMLMLPPQFQNLTPQQLNELRNKPQFQNMLRQYYQRQQMAQQQQQMSQKSGSRPASGPNMYMDRTSMGQNPGSPSLNMNMAAGDEISDRQVLAANMNAMGLNAGSSHPNDMPLLTQARNSQALYLQQQYTHLNQQLIQSSQNLQRPAMSDINPASGGPMGAVSASGIAAQKYAAQLAQQRQSQLQASNPGAVVPPGMKNLDPAFSMKNGHQQSAIPTGFVKEKIKIPPHFAPDVLQNINLTPLSSLTEWSQELAKENKPVPLDVKLYEDIIKKDDFYLRKMLSQTQSSKKLIDRMARDIQSYSTVKQLRMAAIDAAAKNQYSNSIWGEGYSGYGNGVTNSANRVVMPFQNKCFSKPGQMTMTDAELNKQVLKNIASNPSKRIVPIRLEFDLERDRFKLRDTFLWDLNDTTYPIKAFLENLIDDYSFITDINFQTILRSVNEQIKEYKEKPPNAIGEIRIPIKIDLLINNTHYTDKFEWDILSDKDDDPEEFASILCDELSLPGEFATAIAFSIREKSQMYFKALSLVGYTFDGSHIREDEVRSNMASPLRIQNPDSGQNDDFITMLRTPSLVGDYSPSITKISQLEIEKIDKELERDSRRRRRHNDGFSYNENGPNLLGTMFRGTASRRSANHSGRGTKTTLPDLSDVPKTFRTPFPSSVLPGGIDLGTREIFTYNELVINRSQVPNPDFKPPAPPGMVTIFKDSAGSFFMKIKSRKLLRQ